MRAEGLRRDASDPDPASVPPHFLSGAIASGTTSETSKTPIPLGACRRVRGSRWTGPGARSTEGPCGDLWDRPRAAPTPRRRAVAESVPRPAVPSGLPAPRSRNTLR